MNCDNRCRDLFPAMWLNDLFMKRVEENKDWSLFCPSEAPGLNTTWGEEFEKLYLKYEQEKTYVRETIKAKVLFRSMIRAMVSSGMYMLSKDNANRKSNHQHLGTTQNMNLCCEICQYCSPDEVSVCTLASVALPMFVKDGKFDFDLLHKVTRVVARNLDIVIDKNQYPSTGDDKPEICIPKGALENYDAAQMKQLLEDMAKNPTKYIHYKNRAKNSSESHRPIGIGVQGLADVFMMLGYAFESEEAAQLNKDIFETMYHAALTESNVLAREKGYYPTYPGSPISKGIYQFHFWNVTPSNRWVNTCVFLVADAKIL